MGNEIVLAKNEKKRYGDFYKKLRDKVNKWAKNGHLEKKSGKWTDYLVQYLLILPDMVHLMIKLFADRKVPKHYKGYILVVLAYLISPIDVIPDFIPVAGFIDDLVVMVVMLNKIINAGDEVMLERIKTHWAGKDDVFEKVKEIFAVINSLSAHIPGSLYTFMTGKKKNS